MGILLAILGTDILHQTVRFPVTKQSTTLTDEKGNYIDVAASDVKLMGPDYPLYTADGGVKCYVIEAIPRPDWLKNYYHQQNHLLGRSTIVLSAAH